MSKRRLALGIVTCAVVAACSDSVGPPTIGDSSVPQVVVSDGELRTVALRPRRDVDRFPASDATTGPQVLFSSTAGSSEGLSEFSLYATGVPVSSMGASAPVAETLTNLDVDRDEFPGLLMAKSSVGLAAEADPTKYQLWVGPEGPYDVSGRAQLVLWSAMKDFAAEKRGMLEAGLFECNPDGSACTPIAQSYTSASPWDNGSGSWVERAIVFGSVAHSVPSGRALAVKVTVSMKSDDDMWLAYGSSAYPARLTFVTNKLAIETYETSFWAVKGQDRSIQIDYLGANCGTMAFGNYILATSLNQCPFMRFTVPSNALDELPDGTRLARGDSVLISVSVDSTDIVIHMGPSGLQFKRSATLQIWYGGAGGDLNGDGIADETDAYIKEKLLGLWYQATPGDPWELMSEAEHSTTEEWFRAPVDHFSGFAVAY